MIQVNDNTEVTGLMLDRGADVNKMNDDGVTALTATLALLLSDRPLVRRPELTRPGPSSPPPPPPPVSDQVDEDARVGVDSTTRTVGRLNVIRASRAVVKDLLNDSPVPPPTVYFNAAGQIQTPGEKTEQKTTDLKVVADQKRKRAPAADQPQQQQLLKQPSAAAGGSGRPSPASATASSKLSAAVHVDGGSAMSAAVPERSNLSAHVSDEEEQRCLNQYKINVHF